ncbi:hypothetical protein Tco_0769928 [Tanacetum coccineum]|uniref:Uncharacterized protein n=1 Tax=Tanacetum coccineum TaxID=301880 RepID=A0ABQ4ZDQ0_9ASTR
MKTSTVSSAFGTMVNLLLDLFPISRRMHSTKTRHPRFRSTSSKCHSSSSTLAMKITDSVRFKLNSDEGVPVGPVFLLGLLALAIDAACAFRAEEMPSLISFWMAAKVMAGVSDVDVLLGGILSTEDNT